MTFSAGLASVLAVMAFSQRCSDQGMDDPRYVYSRGYWSCLVSGTLMLVATFGFILDWLLSYPYSELTPAINALVLPAVMVCSVVAIGASVYALLEDWTYSEALIFCWTAVTTIGRYSIIEGRYLLLMMRMINMAFLIGRIWRYRT